jgi:hypothetical protein
MRHLTQSSKREQREAGCRDRPHAARRVLRAPVQPWLINLVDSAVLQQRLIKSLFSRLSSTRRSQSSPTKSEHLECQGANYVFGCPRDTTGCICRLHISNRDRTRPILLAPYGSWWGDHTRLRHSHQHRHTKSESTDENQPQETPKGRFRLSSRSQISGSRSMTTGRWSPVFGIDRSSASSDPAWRLQRGRETTLAPLEYL